MDQLDQVVHFYRKLLCLVNGSSSSFIQSSKGSKQGEPLSSYLFMIVMEAHSCLLKRAKVGGFPLRW